MDELIQLFKKIPSWGWIVTIILVVLAFASGNSGDGPPPLPTGEPPAPTATLAPGETPMPTPTVTGVPPSATATPVIPPTPAGIQRIVNPGFEGAYICRDEPTLENETLCAPIGVILAYKYPPVIRSQVAAKHPVPGEPKTNTLALPEYFAATKDMRGPDFVGQRVYEGENSLAWKCDGRECTAGVMFIIPTRIGEQCVIFANVMSHSGNTTSQASETVTADEQANSTWVLFANLAGYEEPATAFLESNITMEYGYWSGHYDHWIQISMPFTANSYQTTVGVYNERLWPIAHNTSYLDNFRVECRMPSSFFRHPDSGRVN